jgi:hypothetical protein
MTATGLGKLLVAMGLLIAVVGAVAWALGRAGFKGLPGDLRYAGEHVRIYVPIVTCLLLSLGLSLLFWLWRWWSGR